MTLEKVDFGYNRSISAAAWKMLLGGLAGSAAEDISFQNCYLDKEKTETEKNAEYPC